MKYLAVITNYPGYGDPARNSSYMYEVSGDVVALTVAYFIGPGRMYGQINGPNDLTKDGILEAIQEWENEYRNQFPDTAEGIIHMIDQEEETRLTLLVNMTNDQIVHDESTDDGNTHLGNLGF